MNKHQKLILNVLHNSKGDDANRARSAFRHHTPEEMKLEHGQSGKTRQEILEGYERHESEVDEAIAWVSSIKSDRENVLKLRTEINCRIEHGADSGGHLEYVQKQLDVILQESL